MKRRSFLAMLGVAPVVASIPAIAATPKASEPFKFEDGKLRLDLAKIGTVRSLRLYDPRSGKWDSQMTIDLDKGTVTVCADRYVVPV